MRDVANSDLPVLCSVGGVLVLLCHIQGFGLLLAAAMAYGVRAVCWRETSLAPVSGAAAFVWMRVAQRRERSAVVGVVDDKALAARLRCEGLNPAALFMPKRVIDVAIKALAGSVA